MCSSNGTDKVLDIARHGGDIYSGLNVQLYAPTDPEAQEWLIIGAQYGTYKILPRTNMSLALTTTESQNNGTASGTSSISDGNIFVSTLTESEYQEWYIIEDGEYLMSDTFVSPIENGFYYFNNRYTGKYFHSNGSYMNQASGKIADLGNTIRWKITHINDLEYTIQSADTLQYLCASDSTSVTTVYLKDMTDETIPAKYRWSISVASGGDHDSVGSESFKLSGNEIAGDDTLCLTVDDHEVEHLVAGIGLDGAVGYLLVESGVGAQKELLSGLSACIEGTAYLHAAE